MAAKAGCQWSCLLFTLSILTVQSCPSTSNLFQAQKFYFRIVPSDDLHPYLLPTHILVPSLDKYVKPEWPQGLSIVSTETLEFHSQYLRQR
ncbi:hypothetical protein F4677DRAFT_64734 [Hypoxylon crocopeplum]|nr:hypothetical protein F4677DRAFT_64734 [Hypoxylon crocopeplum]